jgi:hypothetical protein
MDAQPKVMMRIHAQKSRTTKKEARAVATKSDTKQSADHGWGLLALRRWK